MDPFEALTSARRRGRRAVLVTVLSVEGDAPSHPGAKLVVDGDRILAGTLGCSEFDSAGVALARQALTENYTTRQRVAFAGHETPRAIELFAEAQQPDPTVVVVGATPVATAIAGVAHATGRRVVLLSSSAPSVPGEHAETIVGPPERTLTTRGVFDTDAVVVTDHDAAWVDDVLLTALSSAAAFVGMLGSRRHAPAAVERLRAAGLDEDMLRRLRAPCGLDIGSRSPGEIALSIMAEIVAAERGRDGGPMGLDWSRPHPNP